MEETFVPKEPQHGLHRFSTATTIIIVVILILLALVAGYAAGWNLRQDVDTTPTATTTTTSGATSTSSASTTSASTSAVSSTSASPSSTSSTYTNTKYGYSFSYPSTQQITAIAGDNYNATISADAEGVNIFPVGEVVGNSIFYVSASTADFTVDSIKALYGASAVVPTSATVAGQSAYLVGTSYYVQAPDGKVLALTLAKDNSVAASILSSFAFTK